MSPSRRSLLASISASLALSGCLDGRSDTTATSEQGDKQATPAESPTLSPSATAQSTEPLVYSFYIVNNGETDRCVQFLVQPPDGATVASGSYRVSPAGVLEFTDATTVGTRYTVDVRLSDGRSFEKEWTPERCLDYAGGREASKAGFVAFDADSLYLAENGCDAVSEFLRRTRRVDPESDDCAV